MSYQFTRPDADQVKFTSDRTGEHLLEVYLQNAELGNRTLAALLTELFDPVTGAQKVPVSPADVLAAAASAVAANNSALAAALSASALAGGFVASVNGTQGAVTLKTVGGTALTGSGDIFLRSPDTLSHLLNIT